jgi:hypothetical protein
MAKRRMRSAWRANSRQLGKSAGRARARHPADCPSQARTACRVLAAGRCQEIDGSHRLAPPMTKAFIGGAAPLVGKVATPLRKARGLHCLRQLTPTLQGRFANSGRMSRGSLWSPGQRPQPPREEEPVLGFLQADGVRGLLSSRQVADPLASDFAMTAPERNGTILFDHLVGASNQRVGWLQPESLGCLEVYK